MNLEKEIDFILSHFGDEANNNLFPRKIMTSKSNGQFTVYSKDEILKRCMESDFTDCRINAYHEYTRWEKYDLVRQPPDFIFIDLDLSSFSKYKDPKKTLDSVLKNTLKKMQVCGNEPSQPSRDHHSNQRQKHQNIRPIHPTVLWTGNGYHIYLPIHAVVLDAYEQFSKDKFPNLFSMYDCKYNEYSVSEVFLKFAEVYFTGGKADPQHRPKFKSCLIRFPNTFNSKCLANGKSHEESKVKLIQEWNGYRPPIQYLTKEFRRWLVQEDINQKILLKRNRNFKCKQFKKSGHFQINWIERLLLQTGIPDGRKETLRLILGPYIIKRKNYEESVIILQEWLGKCDIVKPLDRNFNPQQRIKSSLKNTKGFLKLENLKIKYQWLYSVITSPNQS